MNADVPFLATMMASFEAIGGLFLVALTGFLFVRWKIMSDVGLRNLSRLTIDAIVPCALGVSMVKGFNSESMSMVWPLVMLPPIFIIATLLLTLGYFRLWKGKNASADRAISALAAIPNSFYVPFPLALAVTHPDQHVMVGVLIGAAVLAVNPLQWTLGTWLVIGDRDAASQRWKDSLKHTLNGPLIGVVGGVIISLIPGMQEAARREDGSMMLFRMIFGAMEFLGRAMAPVAMIIIGGLIAQCEIRKAVSIRNLLPVIAFRFVIVPGIIFWMLRDGLLPVERLVGFVLLLEAASPSAMNLAVAAKRFEGEWEIVSGVQLIVNIIAIVVLPFWMTVGLRL